MDNQREQEALTAYSKLLRSKGATDDAIKQREDVLNLLIPKLSGIASESIPYRDMVDELLLTLDDAKWSFFLAVVRDYFWFWVKDFKAIAAMHADGAYDIEPPDLKAADVDMKALWKNIDNEKFSMVENWPVKTYSLALREQGASSDLIESRVKLVKLLIVRMRNAPELNNKHYRVAVDSLMHMFKNKDTRTVFLAVVREFFYFWIGDPEAAKNIRIDLLDIA